MITFHNDHLVASEFCKLIYDTVPDDAHVPVICVPHTAEYRVVGRTDHTTVRLHLQSIYYWGINDGGEFGVWKQLLHTTYHEFGHIATEAQIKDVSNEQYQRREREYSYCENLADQWANSALLRLMAVDRRLEQPRRLGKYFDGRLMRSRISIRKANPGKLVPDLLDSYRKFKSGGQLSTREMSEAIHEVNTRLIRKLAADLAYNYTDRAGRLHMYFAWGDIQEIARRIAEHRAEHKVHSINGKTRRDPGECLWEVCNE